MNDPPQSDPERVWERGWEGHEAQQRQRLARLPLSEKLAWLEEAQRLVDQLNASRQKSRDDSTSGG